VRVLIFHGYLLRGTGSNVYNAELAAALIGLGHEVDLVCQERHADDLQWVGAVGDWDGGELVVRRLRETGATVYRPDIGGLLPVYVADRYEDIEARPFQDLTDDELDRYIRDNEVAVTEVVNRSHPDVALANHLIMGPAILARALPDAGVPYAVKVHGSALEYTVKPYPRFLPYARDGVAAAGGVLTGSRHTAESLWAALGDPNLPDRTGLAPPGVDVALFRPRERTDAFERLGALTERVARDAGARRAQLERPVGESTFSRDQGATAAALQTLLDGSRDDRLVSFVGKLIVSKGIDLLLCAWPLLLSEVAGARLVVIGFGAYAGTCERLVEALSDGDLDVVAEIAAEGRAAEGGPRSPLRLLTAFLQWLDQQPAERERYLASAARMRERVVFTGRLEHREVAEVLTLCEAMVVPSTFPEAFGMVAAEAAACGALPISAAHSGLAEVTLALAQNVPEEVRGLLSFSLDEPVVPAIANRLRGWMLASDEVRELTRASLVATVTARWSWEQVARQVIAAAQGALAPLPVRAEEVLEPPKPPA
jgi:glycosyltransferase involved in cell wall biosynthesis